MTRGIALVIAFENWGDFVHFLKIIYSFLAVLGLCCCKWAFSGCGMQGYSLVAVLRLLIAVASLAAEQQLQSTGSVVVAQGFNCPEPCGIFPDQGLNPRPLRWQVDS